VADLPFLASTASYPYYGPRIGFKNYILCLDGVNGHEAVLEPVEPFPIRNEVLLAE
jgi:hypothetical protein